MRFVVVSQLGSPQDLCPEGRNSERVRRFQYTVPPFSLEQLESLMTVQTQQLWHVRESTTTVIRYVKFVAWEVELSSLRDLRRFLHAHGAVSLRVEETLLPGNSNTVIELLNDPQQLGYME